MKELLESGVLAEIVTGVLAAIITSAITIATFRKQNKLQYITAERKAWREEIRDIAKKIKKSNERNIATVLVDLKVRINAYGLASSNNDHEKDKHIWEVIESIEKVQWEKLTFEQKQIEKEELEKNKNLLINYLSILLKQDWERAKREVNGDWLNLISYGAVFMSLICYLMGFLLWLKKGQVSFGDIVSLVILVGIYTIMVWGVFFVLPKKSFIEDFMNKAVESRKEKKIKKALGIELLTGILYIIFSFGGMFLLIVCYQLFGINFKNNLEILAFTLLYVLFASFFFGCKWHELFKKNELRNEYNEAINACKDMQKNADYK